MKQLNDHFIYPNKSNESNRMTVYQINLLRLPLLFTVNACSILLYFYIGIIQKLIQTYIETEIIR